MMRLVRTPELTRRTAKRSSAHSLRLFASMRWVSEFGNAPAKPRWWTHGGVAFAELTVTSDVACQPQVHCVPSLVRSIDVV
jgi:hypothetical protein